MKVYSEYKYVEEKWIGKVPKNWRLKKIKHTTYVKGRVGWKGLTSDEFLEKGYSYLITGTDFRNGRVDWETCYHIDKERYEEDPYIQLKEDDLLITKDGTIGKVALVKELEGYACLNSGIFVVRPNTDDYVTKFMYWVLISDVFFEFNEFTKSGSTIKHLYQNVFVEFKFPTPSIEEQISIANFLDHKTAQIDDSIEKRRELIELLKEHRSAIINEAVTKGINPDAPMRDSGIKWIGEIPKHWEHAKLQWLSKIYSGGTPDKNNPEYWENGTIPWLNSGTVNQGVIEEYSALISKKGFENSSAKWIKPKDIVIALAGQGKTKGMAGLVTFETTCNQSLGVISPYNKINSNYLYWWLRKNYRNIRGLAGDGKRDGLNLTMIGSIPVPIPTQEEQNQIVEYIETETARTNEEIKSIQQEIDLLEEYRQSLIAEAVTGKIDVRDYPLN